MLRGEFSLTRVGLALAFLVACVLAGACREVCDDGVDNDGDGRADCDDGACAETAACDVGAVQIQRVQDGTVQLGARVTIESVFVTVLRRGATGTVNLYVQEPQGQQNGVTYPQRAGMAVFIQGAFAANEPDLAGLVVGDCVTLTGDVSEFGGDTELSSVTAFGFAPFNGCGTPPSPFVVDLGEIATDVELFTGGDQPSATAEAYEGALVTVQNVVAIQDGDAFSFRVTDAFSADLRISNFLLSSTPTVVAGDTFTSISGVFHTFNDTFELQPRSGSDIVR